MDPVAGVGLWLLSNAVVPDAYTRLVGLVRSKSDYRRLATVVHADTGIRLGRRYKHWLRREETWADLVARDQDAYDRLVASLTSSLARGVFRQTAKNPAAAPAIVNSTITFFLPTLDPSTATAVADIRAESRHVEVMTRLDASANFADRLALLPPAPRGLLSGEQVHQPVAERLVAGVTSGDPREVIASWVSNWPSWLQDAPAVMTLALGQLAQAYAMRMEASILYERAADLGHDPSRLYAWN